MYKLIDKNGKKYLSEEVGTIFGYRKLKKYK